MKPKKRDIYAIQTGQYAGEMWIFCNKKSNTYKFLSIPVMKNREVDREIFESGIANKILIFVEKIPRYVYNIARKQFIQNEKTSNN